MKDNILYELALKLYQDDWKKTDHNSFMPDMYVFKNVLNVKESMPYVVKAGEILKLMVRGEKIKKIKKKI